jgi:ABC-type uncharacterized transport system ATPase subunit
VKTVSNENGIIGGVKAWDKKMAQYFTETSPLNIVHQRSPAELFHLFTVCFLAAVDDISFRLAPGLITGLFESDGAGNERLIV